MRLIFFSLLLLPMVSAAMDPVILRGKYLYNSVTKERFYVKGVTYGRETEADFKHYWLPAMETIRNISSEINTVRIYRVHPTIHQSQYKMFPDDTLPPTTPPPPTPVPCTCGGGCSQDPNVFGTGGYCNSGGGCAYNLETAPSGMCCYTCGQQGGGVFEVDADYDQFMQEMERLGLYVIVPLTPAGKQPWGFCTLGRVGTPELSEQTCYPSCLLSYAMAVMNTFGKYPNTLGYVIGNEVFDEPEHMVSAPCIKAFNRDVKHYMRTCGSQRVVPTIYATADRPLMEKSPSETNGLKMGYLTCGPWDSRVDIFGMNVYRWCGAADNMQTSGYQLMDDGLAATRVPLLLTEFGCALSKPRNWRMLKFLFGPEMTDNWSGGTAYSYGNTGGDEFALFTGGSNDREPDSEPGYEKSCSPNNASTCSVDFLRHELETDMPNAPKSPLSGSGFCEQVGTPDWDRFAAVECPIYEEFLTEEMQHLPKTRMYAPGWVGVNCPAGALPQQEQKDKDCYLPTQAGRPCYHGNWCVGCTLAGPHPGFPECKQHMAFLSQNWYDSDELAAAGVDGSVCSFQHYLATQNLCPYPDVTMRCDDNGYCNLATPTQATQNPTKRPSNSPTTQPPTAPSIPTAQAPTIHHRFKANDHVMIDGKIEAFVIYADPVSNTYTVELTTGMVMEHVADTRIEKWVQSLPPTPHQKKESNTGTVVMLTLLGLLVFASCAVGAMYMHREKKRNRQMRLMLNGDEFHGYHPPDFTPENLR